MQNSYLTSISNVIPYDISTILNQLYQYKCFEVNINRALFLKNQNISHVCLINAYWFNHWKKVTCYEILKNEIDLNYQNNNFNVLSNGFCTIFNSINSMVKFEPLEANINNNDLKGSLDWDSEFEIISPELWNLLAPNGNINQNTNIDLKLDYLSNDSLILNISNNSCYVLFWNIIKFFWYNAGFIFIIF